MEKTVTIPTAWITRLLELKKECSRNKIATDEENVVALGNTNLLLGYIESAESFITLDTNR